MQELGYNEGKNITLTYRSAMADRSACHRSLPSWCKPSQTCLVTGFGTLAAKAAMGATTTIPVVFYHGRDPIGAVWS